MRFWRDHRWTPKHVSPYLDDELPTGARARLQRHVADCPDCRGVLRSLERMLLRLSEVPSPAASEAPDLAFGIRARLRERHRAPPGQSSDTQDVARGHALVSERWLTMIRVAAAAVFVAFGAGKFVNHASELSSFRLYGLPVPDAFTYAIGALELLGGLLLAARRLVVPVALVLAGDMVGAIVVSGLAYGEIISLTLAPALLVAMLAIVHAEGREWWLRPRRPGGG